MVNGELSEINGELSEINGQWSFVISADCRPFEIKKNFHFNKVYFCGSISRLSLPFVKTERKVRTAKGNTPVKSRLFCRRAGEETVPQKITTPAKEQR